jgi:ATP-binding cassette subfamily B protein
MHAMRMAHLDASAADAKLAPGTLKRIWSFARPYKAALTAFLGTLLLVSIIGIAPPLVFRRLIDKDIPEGNTGGVAVWAAVILFIGLIKGLADLAGRRRSVKA